MDGGPFLCTPKELAQMLRGVARFQGLPTPNSRHGLRSLEKCSRFRARTHSWPESPQTALSLANIGPM
jgi:hypothetical protein